VNLGPERDPAAPDAPISESYPEGYGTRHGDPESLRSGRSYEGPIYLCGLRVTRNLRTSGSACRRIPAG
ncbi:hypothetical protein PIB30_106548, partial [Stylosanthes scabra]|nr:hypothetical protein [Stylosanthes scabra]